MVMPGGSPILPTLRVVERSLGWLRSSRPKRSGAALRVGLRSGVQLPHPCNLFKPCLYLSLQCKRVQPFLLHQQLPLRFQ